ncbi:hypothetical protein [Streptomyces sp. SAS_270]|uniref:hypothetical protein n=1 Tax=Streptomyces sp. SAS_270 TaxID=3412748 RepID=UPI00403C4623
MDGTDGTDGGIRQRGLLRARSAAAVKVVAAVTGLVLLSACGGGSFDGDGTDGGKNAGSGGRAAATGGPAYKGPELPGFAKKAAWSLPPTEGGGTPGALDLGETLLFAKDASGKYVDNSGPEKGSEQGEKHFLHSSDEPESLTLEFRDAKTGAVTKSLKVKTDSVTATTWHDGAPAVAVATSSTSASDGLTEAKKTSTATLYDAHGAKLGSSPVPQDKYNNDDPRLLTEGYRVELDDDVIRLVPIDGGTTRTLTCTGQLAQCEFHPETGTADGFATHAPLISGQYYAGFLNATNYDNDREQITLSDLATGKQVWSTADVEVPKGVALDDDGERQSGAVRVVRVADGKVLVAWSANVTASSWIYAWYDVKSGALTGSYEAPEDALLSPSGELVAKDREEIGEFDGTAVWQVADGKQLWAQAEGETALDPVRFTADGSVLYGLTDGDTGLVVDARTRKVLVKSLPEDHIPFVDAATGYGYLSTEDGFFTFAPSES